MLGKLMKHEFRATGRIGAPLCGIMLALSVIAGMVIRFMDEGGKYGWLDRMGSIFVTLYGMSIFAVGIGIFIVLMQHFKRNLLGDEGYLMRTLPVSIHELLLSKLFVALAWYLVSFVLTILSAVLVGVLSGGVKLGEFGRLWEMLRQSLAGVDAGIWVQAFLAYIGAAGFLTLLFYADFTMTQSFSKHKLLYNVMGVVIFIVLLRLIFALNGWLDAALPTSIGVIGGVDGPMEIHVTRGTYIGMIELYLFDALLYFLTWAFLKYRPNLE
ncbi:MAG: ABC transporter permease [Oscillospiraceae bacterium]|nr:ABC transporter permease [Oscillospiraceae bacterium]